MSFPLVQIMEILEPITRIVLTLMASIDPGGWWICRKQPSSHMLLSPIEEILPVMVSNYLISRFLWFFLSFKKLFFRISQTLQDFRDMMVKFTCMLYDHVRGVRGVESVLHSFTEADLKTCYREYSELDATVVPTVTIGCNRLTVPTPVTSSFDNSANTC